MFSIRVLFAPQTRKVGGRTATVGGTLSLVTLGKVSTLAPRDEEKPAVLRFHGRYLDSARKAPGPFQAFAELEGKLLRRTNSSPRFSVASHAGIRYLDSSASDTTEDNTSTELQAELQLSYAELNFVGVPRSTTDFSLLKLPVAPATARYLELVLELEVNGQAEAAAGSNAILDLPLATLSVFEATIVDKTGKPIEGQAFDLELPDGAVVSGATAADGQIRVAPVLRGPCTLRLRGADLG